jgi:hypothetical protein
LGCLDDGLHDWGETRDCTAAKIVTVGEATREDDCIYAVKICIVMPKSY